MPTRPFLVTEWAEFEDLDLDAVKKAMAAANFVDLRNVFSPAKMESGRLQLSQHWSAAGGVG